MTRQFKPESWKQKSKALTEEQKRLIMEKREKIVFEEKVNRCFHVGYFWDHLSLDIKGIVPKDCSKTFMVYLDFPLKIKDIERRLADAFKGLEQVT